jgi:CHAT domain
MKILILASNPRKDLNLDREIRDLKDVIEKSRNRQEFEVEDALAVRVGDLQNLLFRYRPQIVHFCGHGSGQQGLVFEGNDGGEQWVRAEALSEMFRLFAEHVGCVVLNACYSDEQADAIVEHIDYVVGVKQEILDDAAIAFSKGFYRALGYECSVEQAFEFGRNAIQLEISGSSKTRSAVTEAARKAEVMEAIEHTDIPEHLKPVLKIKPNLTQSLRANITVPAQPLSPETRVTIQVEIDQSLEADAKVKQYRDRVREFLSDRKLSALEIIRLERLRKDLGLSEAEAKRILAEEMEPIRRGQDEYEAMLIGLIEAEHYPLDAAMQKELAAVRQELGLTNEEVESIATPILAAADEDYQARLVQEEQQQALEQRREEGAIRRSLALEQQQALEQRREEEARWRSLLKSVEFRVATVKVGTKTIRKPGLFGKKAETINTCNITYQQGRAEYFAEDLSEGVTLEMVAIAGGTF